MLECAIVKAVVYLSVTIVNRPKRFKMLKYMERDRVKYVIDSSTFLTSNSVVLN